MKQGRKLSKRGWAGIVAVALIAAIALTGTLAWRSISQQAINEAREVNNPGGRIHDYFNGVENKDVFAENFTDTELGVPVFVRVKLLEYMETGDEAGLNRHPAEGVTRYAKPLVDGMDINNTSTWHLHKPGESATDDPFHTYWKWKMGGETVYMPTFNKNKDSLSVELNGTYVGRDGKFEEGTPYDDYTVYTIGMDVTAPAYYDADIDNIDDEYLTDPRANKVPGGGGTEGTNYTTVEETHTAKKTQKTVAVLTMDEWEAKGKPIGNYWVWDTDGWAYWAEPLMPQTATGLFLDKLSINKRTTEPAYYALDVVGEFATEGDWGNKNAADKKDQGFHANGFSTKAEALLDRVATAVQGENKVWYIPMGYNVYQRINNDAGDLGNLVCAGLDTAIGTSDDLTRRKVVYVEGGANVGPEGSQVNYGQYFLEPTAQEPYYRAMGADKLLGTEDDPRLWLDPEDGTFPEDAVDKIVDNITVTADGNATEIEKSAKLQLTAHVFLNDTELDKNNEVKWTVTTVDGGAPSENTYISSSGVLTVDEHEPADELVVIATSKKDDRVSSTPYHLSLHGKGRITLESAGNATQMRAGETLRFRARFYHGDELVTDESERFTWNAQPMGRGVTDTLSVDDSTGLLTVGRSYANQMVRVTATYWEGGKPFEAEVDIQINEGAPIKVSVNGPATTKIGAAGNLKYVAHVDGAEQLNDSSVTWSVGASTDGGVTLNNIPGVSITSGGILTIDKNTYTTTGTTNADTIYVRATANDSTAGGAKNQTVLKIERPATLTVGTSETDNNGNPRPARVLNGKTIGLKASLLDKNGNPYPADELEWTISGNAQSGTSLSTTTGAESTLTIASNEVASGAAPHKVTVKVSSKVDPDKSSTYDINVAHNKVWALNVNGTATATNFVMAYDDWENGKDRVLVVGDRDCTSLAAAPYRKDVTTDASWTNSYTRKFFNNIDGTTATGGTSNDAFLNAYSSCFWKESDNDWAKIYTRKNITGSDTDLSNFEVTRDRVFLLTEADLFGTLNGDPIDPATHPYDFTAGVKLDDPEGVNWKREYPPNAGAGKVGTWLPWHWMRSPFGDDNRRACYYDDKTGSGYKVVQSSSLNALGGGCMYAMWIKASSFYGG